MKDLDNLFGTRLTSLLCLVRHAMGNTQEIFEEWPMISICLYPLERMAMPNSDLLVFLKQASNVLRQSRPGCLGADWPRELCPHSVSQIHRMTKLPSRCCVLHGRFELRYLPTAANHNLLQERESINRLLFWCLTNPSLDSFDQ